MLVTFPIGYHCEQFTRIETDILVEVFHSDQSVSPKRISLAEFSLSGCLLNKKETYEKYFEDCPILDL